MVELGQIRVERLYTGMSGLKRESGGHQHGIDYPSSKREVQGLSQKLLC